MTVHDIVNDKGASGMQYGKYLLGILLILQLAGCAGRQNISGTQLLGCIVAGAAVGATAAAVIVDDDDPGSDDEGTIIAAATGGGLAGALLCGAGGDRPAPTAPVVAQADDPLRDSDGDGVNDDQDICPGTAARYTVDSLGCPELIDSDGDGIVDELDKCPNTSSGTAVQSDGCPPVGAAMLVLNEVNFDCNQATLTRAARTIPDSLAQTLRENPNIRLRVTGHTDSIGSDAYNRSLALRRANSARNYLVQQGISGNRLMVDGQGEARPIASNDTEVGRARNRRVEFMVIEK